MQRTSLRGILKGLENQATAERAADAVQLLSRPKYVHAVATALLKDFGKDPAATRVLIRAAGRSRSRELHDILAERLMDGRSQGYEFELIDALSATQASDYAAAIIPFLESDVDEPIRSTAAYALGMLNSPIAILPLVRLYQNCRKSHMRQIVLRAIERIASNAVPRVSVDVYLADVSDATRREITNALKRAA